MQFYPANGQLRETVGRQRASNWGELDTLTIRLDGNTQLADSIPSAGTPFGYSPGYPGIELKSNRKVQEPGGKTLVELDYVGLFSGGTIGPVSIGFTSSEQELEYQQFFVTPIFIPGSTPGSNPVIQPSTEYQVGTIANTLRYNGRNTIFRYVAKGVPSGPRFQNLAAAKVYSQFIRQSSRGAITTVGVLPIIQYQPTEPTNGGPEVYTAAINPLGSTIDISQLIGNGPWGFSGPSIYCSQFGCENVSPNWYRCLEIWTTRFLPGTNFTI